MGDIFILFYFFFLKKKHEINLGAYISIFTIKRLMKFIITSGKLPRLQCSEFYD
jgi:hypothetical protein